MFRTTLDELRSATRYAARRPLFAVIVTATLSVAIAVAATAFGLARAVLWRTLPFDDAGALVFVWEEVERDGQRRPARVTGARYAAWRDSASGLDAVSLFGAAGFTLEDPDGAATVRGVRVSANYFETLGIRPALGRTFTPQEEVPGNHRVTIISDAFWRRRFGGRGDAVGKTIRLSGEPYTIVGVMPPVTFPAWPVNPATVTLEAESRQLWVPIPRTPALEQSGSAHVFGVLARLAPGITRGDVVERLNRTSGPAATDPHGARLEPLREQLVGDARTPLLLLTGAALAVLLIACANLAALYVSAFESRRMELALRRAVGAGTFQLVRQLTVEVLILALAGAIGGILLARIGLAFAPGLLPSSIPFLTAPSLDLRIVAFAAALALIASLMFTAWPIARSIVMPPMPRGAAVRSRGSVYRLLVVSQVALTMALVTAAGLLGQSLQSVRREQPGFAIDRVFVADIGLPAVSPSSAPAVARIEQQVLSAVAARPHVLAAVAAYDHPLEANWSEIPTIVGESGSASESRQAELRIVSPGYVEALDVHLLDGRTFTERDTFDAPGVALVNEALASGIGGRVLGRRLRSGTPAFAYGSAAPSEFEIVGIVNNERFRGLERPSQPAFYLTTRQFPQRGFSMLVRTEGDPTAVAGDVRSAIRAVDGRITLNRPTSLEALLDEQLASRRVTTDVIGGFAAAALGLAALGMYGLLAMLVGSRRRELGVRLAIGAAPLSVARQVVGDGLRTALVGVLFGCGCALAAGRLVQHLLVGVSPRDPLTLALVAITLLATAACAALVPAWRAAHVDPIEVLRAE